MLTGSLNPLILYQAVYFSVNYQSRESAVTVTVAEQDASFGPLKHSEDGRAKGSSFVSEYDL